MGTYSFKAKTEVETRGLSGGEQMLWHSKGQTRVVTIAIIVINGLCNNENRCRSVRSITFTALQQPLLA
ncbi:hypothetical protein J1N35_011440 [Gossypium stocksii]|uniref:Uncharacterized protein n=1 Tax=Gossypium stocksii TaxID=47602 RepID=A0A9D3W3L1_9ROSI|nr:hypothetical protein J1N35_011440 [Gossypium stocksii]